MREILFRGKITELNKWIEGIPIKTHIGVFIAWEENPHYCSQYNYMEINEIARVDSETVGQYTGLKDKNGKKIFEGDIVRLTPPNKTNGIYVPSPHDPTEDRILEVVFFDGVFSVDMSKWWKYGHGRLPLRDYETERLEVIGNIHENPELLDRAGMTDDLR